jgi:hypothetical protein
LIEQRSGRDSDAELHRRLDAVLLHIKARARELAVVMLRSLVAFISVLDRVLDPWRELIAFVRSTSTANVQFDLIEGTLGRKRWGAANGSFDET